MAAAQTNIEIQDALHPGMSPFKLNSRRTMALQADGRKTRLPRPPRQNPARREEKVRLYKRLLLGHALDGAEVNSRAFGLGTSCPQTITMVGLLLGATHQWKTKP